MDIFNKTRVKELEANNLFLKKEIEELSKDLDEIEANRVELLHTIKEQKAKLKIYTEKEALAKSAHPSKFKMNFAFEIAGRKFFNHIDPSQLQILRYEQYQVCLMELESGLGKTRWKELIGMLSEASQLNAKNQIDLKAINYVATEMEYITNKIIVPDVMEDMFCLYIIEEDEDPYKFDEAKHIAKKKLFKDNGYLSVSNEFFFGFMDNLKFWGNMSEQEQKQYIQKAYMEEAYKDMTRERVINTYQKN